MRRREFIALFGSAAVWLPAGHAQERGGTRRIGVLMVTGENDRDGLVWLSKFTTGLEALGWKDGNNAHIDIRWGAGSSERIAMLARELVDLHPDVLLAQGTLVTQALQRETSTIPIVFVTVADPVGDGFVASLARPGGNITGFIFAEGEMGGKWMELLKTIAPNVKRAAAMFNPDTAPDRGAYYLPSFEAAARSLNVVPIPMPVHSSADIEVGFNSLGRELGGGFVATGDPFLLVDRKATVRLAAANKIPAVYYHAIFPRDGGLLSYGPDIGDIFRRAAPYIDRTLRGEKPAELPVQIPTKFEMVINIKSAKALGLTIPQTLLATADEVIE
jgi:putative tryptophan/tyrosine transport system substrate-binding protein